MDGQEFRVRIVAREKQNSDTLYIVDAEVIKKGGSSVGRSKASQFVSIPSDVSISDLVNGVKIFDYSSQKNDSYNVQDIRFSIPETDSSGNTLSDGQREYFNDSKVVDENGNLRVVYHGTQNAGFTVFKRTNNFYTSSREVANSYTNKGGVYEGYLNITNPLEIDCNNERWSRIETDQIDSAVTDLFKEYGASTFEEDDAERTSTADIISVVEDAIEDEALDYDGVIFKNIYDEGMFGNHETGTLLSDVYVTFNSNQFKNRDNLEPTDNPDIRFSMSSPVEESKDLITVHNLNADNIRRLADLGGLPMPSIAIIKAAQGHNMYGDYSFVFDKTTIDPKRNKANKVYGGDAWTPTFPKIEHEVNENKASEIYQRANKVGTLPLFNPVKLHRDNLEEKINSLGGEVELIGNLTNDYGMKQMFLAETGKGYVPMQTKTVREEMNESYKKAGQWYLGNKKDLVNTFLNLPAMKRAVWRKEHKSELSEAYREYLSAIGTDESTLDDVLKNTTLYEISKPLKFAGDIQNGNAIVEKTEESHSDTQKLIDEKIEDKKYRAWLEDLFEGIVDFSGIWNGKEPYTSSGGRRSFKSLHDSLTLDNVVKAMKRTENGKTLFGDNFLAVAQKEFSDVSDIKSDSDRLKTISDEEMEELKSDLAKRESEIIDSFIERLTHSERGDYNVRGTINSSLVESIKGSRNTQNVLAKLKSYGSTRAATEEDAKKILDLAKDAANLPTSYFEAKPERAVTFDEVKAVIAPSNAPEDVLKIFDEAGLDVIFYEAKNNEDRTEKLNSIDDVRFSIEPGMTDEERYNELKDKSLNVVVSEKQNLPLTDKEFEALKAKKLSDAKKAAMKLAKDLNITKVYSNKDIDFEFEYTNRGIEESAQKQFSTRGEGKYINFINLQLNLGAVIDNAELIKVYTDKEYVGENKGHEENENLKHSYVLVSAFADEENIVPVKLTVMEYVDHANPKLRVAITYEAIKKSEIIADRLIKSRESATPTSIGVSLADMLPKINDETLKKQIPPQFYNQESYSFSGTVVSEEDIENPVDEDMYYADDHAMAKRVKVRDEIRAELENLTRDETKLTHGTILNEKSVNKELKQLVNVLMKGSTNLASERRENLEFVNDAAKKLWYMVQSGGGLTNLTAEQKLEISKLAAKVGQEVVSNTRFVDEQLYREGKELRDFFRSTPIRVRDNIKNDINWKDDYKKKNFGRMKLVSENYQGNAYDIDELWQELLESVPAFRTFAPSKYGSLDEIIDESEMFMAIDAALDNTYEVEDVYASDCAQEIELQFAQDFMRAVLKNGEAWQSFADKKKAQYDTNLALLKERQKEAVRDLRRRHAERLNEKLRAEKKKSNERLAKQKARYDEKAEKEKTKRNEQKEKTRSYKARMKSWGHIESNYNYLQKKLLNPKKEEGQNIPEALRKPLAEVLAEFDLQTERSAKLEEKRGKKAMSTAKLDKLKSALERVASEDGSKDFMCHSSLFRTLSDLSESLDGKPLRDLSNEDLLDIDDMLSQIKHMIASQNKLFREGRKQDVASAGEQIIKDMNAKIKKYKRGYSYTGLKGAVKHVFNEDMMTPMDFFDSLGGQMNDMYKNLRLAQDDYIRKVKYLSDFVDDTFSKFSKKSKIRKRPKPGGEIEEWSNEKSAKTFTLSSGEQIRLSAAQMMSLYCLSTREQAMSHILGSGIVISDISPKKRTEKVLGAKVDNTATAVHLTYNDVVEIVGQLTDDQRQIADKLQGLMNGELQNWGNETSMQLYGVRLFKEENYFPIEVEGAYLDGKIGEASGINGNRITSFGFTKPLTENASNPIVVGDIFDIFTAHANKMALYSSYAAALTDFNRVFNYKQRFEDGRLGRSVKGMITDAFGGRSINFIDNFLNDINGQAETRMDGIGEVINATLARYKKAAIGMNVRVLVQQPTAIVRSLYYLSPKYFTPNVYWRPGKAKKEMHEHCPISYWKAEGNYQNDYTRSLKDQIFNRWSNFENISMGFYGLADDMTWAVIWNACKNKVKAEHKDVKVGSEEFYVLCNEVASEVFDRTQVVDSVFHRSDAMRSKNGITKMSSSFMAEPTRTYNMLRSSVVKARRLSMDGHKEQAIKELSKVGMVLIFNAAAVSAAAAVIDAFRGKGDDDDDEEFFETWLRNFGENFLDNASPLQQVVVVKDISELIVGAWAGDSYGNSNMAYEGWEKLANGFAEVQDVFSGDLDFFSWLSGDFGAGLGYVTGVPAYNFIRDAKALWKKMGWDVFADDGIEVSDEESDSENSGSGSGHRTVKDYAKGAAKSALGIGDGDTTPSDVQAMAEQYGIETGSGESSSKKKGVVDKVLESFGIKRDPKSKAKRAFNKEVKSIEKKTKDLSGEEKAKKVNDLAMDGYTKLVDAGDIKGLKHMRKVIEKAGGDVEAFDKSVSKKLSTAYKKTIGTDDIDKREKIKNYLLENGWTEYKISREIVAKSDVGYLRNST